MTSEDAGSPRKSAGKAQVETAKSPADTGGGRLANEKGGKPKGAGQSRKRERLANDYASEVKDRKRKPKEQESDLAASRSIVKGSSYTPLELASLAAQIYRSTSYLGSRHVGSAIYDRDYRDALDRAEWLIREAKSRETEVIHAYQIFPGGGPSLSLDDISARFLEVGWPFMKRSSVDTVVKEVLQTARDEIATLESAAEGVLVAQRKLPLNKATLVRKSRGLVEILRDKLGLKFVLRDADDLAKRLMEVILEQAEANFPEVSMDREVAAELVSAIDFVSYVIVDTDKGSNEYRPHELFRYAAEKEHWEGKLTQRRERLSPDFIPYPAHSDPVSILYSHSVIMPLHNRDDVEDAPKPSDKASKEDDKFPEEPNRS